MPFWSASRSARIRRRTSAKLGRAGSAAGLPFCVAMKRKPGPSWYRLRRTPRRGSDGVVAKSCSIAARYRHPSHMCVGTSTSAWLGLLVVLVSFPLLPAVFALARLARLARLLRLVRMVAFSARALPALKSTLGRRGLLYVAAVLILLITVSGAVMSLAEPQTVKGNIWDGMWWAIVTATTVGYGDISPVTPVGRLVAVALMLFGIGLTATLAASVAAFFVNQDRGDDLSEVAARLERVEQLLVELKAQKERSEP